MNQDRTKAGTAKSSDMSGADRRSARGGAGGSEQVKAVQQALKDKGVDPGDIDGKMGPKTRSALKEFQKKEGLKDTGSPDPETMAKLGIEGKTSSAKDTSASPSASPSESTKPAPGASSASPQGQMGKDAAATKPDSSKTDTTKPDATKK